MQKHKWEKAWEEKKFSIETLVPSILVSKYEYQLHKGDCILVSSPPNISEPSSNSAIPVVLENVFILEILSPRIVE